MDPYCKLTLADQSYETKVMNGAGKNPKWNEVWEVEIKDMDDSITLACMEKDIMKDDEIGSATIKLASLCNAKGTDEWFELQYEGKKAGTIHLKSEFTSNAEQPPKV